MTIRMEVLSVSPRNSPYFTVNTAANYVNIIDPVYSPVEYPILSNGQSANIFARGDSFTVLSAGYVLPECFVMASSPPDPCLIKVPHIFLALKEIGLAVFHYIPEMSGLAGISMPMENFESGISVFVNVPTIYDGPFNLYAGLALAPGYFPRVSMQGVPAALNGTTQLVTVFIKILHNYDLT